MRRMNGIGTCGGWIVAFMMVLGPQMARADTWSFPPEVKDTPYTFGDVRVVLHYDSTKNRSFPEHTLKIFRGDKLLREHAGVGFDQVFANADHRFFLGVSNGGLVKPAWVVFDRDGNIIRQQAHGAGVKYCRMSITVVREWFDSKNPEAQFQVKDGKLKGVSIRGCDGQRVVLPLEEPGSRPKD